MTPTQVAHIMELVHKFSVANMQGNAVAAMEHCAAVEAALRDAPQHAPVVLAQAYRTSAAYDVGYKDGQKQAASGCGRCNDSTKPCDITGSSCVADVTPSAPTAVEPDEPGSTAEAAMFTEWAGLKGYDTAHTYDTERSRWVFLSPMTADLWAAWQARASKGTPL